MGHSCLTAGMSAPVHWTDVRQMECMHCMRLTYIHFHHRWTVIVTVCMRKAFPTTYFYPHHDGPFTTSPPSHDRNMGSCAYKAEEYSETTPMASSGANDAPP